MAEQPSEESLRTLLTGLLSDHAVRSMDNYLQHGTTTTLQHSISVVRTSYAIASHLHLHLNYENLTVGALLHDFFLYDWHSHRQTKGLPHGFTHPDTARRNAAERFHINPEIQHIIVSHMWPLTLRCIPRSREAVIVCAADKYCSTQETMTGFFRGAAAFFRRRRTHTTL